MIVQAKPLSAILALLQSQNPGDILVEQTDDGWSLYAHDPAFTTIVSAVLKTASFTDYEKGESFAVPLEYLLQSIPSTGTVDITVGDGFINIVNGKMRSKRRLVEGEFGPRPVPNIELAGKAMVMSDDLLSAISARIFSHKDAASCVVSIKENSMTLRTVLIGVGDIELEAYEGTADATTELPESGEQVSTFGISVLLPMIKALPKDELMEVRMSTDMPISMEVDCDRYKFMAFAAPWICDGE